MFVIYGSKLYGKVDEIDGVGHVATQFAHLFWIPLLPLKSYFVTEQRGSEFAGTPVGLNIKSVAMAYVRAFSIVFVIAGIGGLNGLLHPEEARDARQLQNFKVMVSLAGFALPLSVVTHMRFMRTATYEDAKGWAEKLQFDSRLRTCIEYAYDKIGREEAERRLAECEPLGDPGAAEVGVDAALGSYADASKPSSTEAYGSDEELDAEIAAAYQRYVTN
ncbi:MAG: hypothetical protein KDA61_05810 [Planctomycetales bacterium]|nr:hypothetical protein [Planctomycetales bacterium]